MLCAEGPPDDREQSSNRTLTSDRCLFNNALHMRSSKFRLRGFRRPREVAPLALGKLERRVLDEAWRRSELSVRDIYLAFDEQVAYTTLMTTLDRLYKKKLLERRKDRRAFLYSAALSRE